MRYKIPWDLRVKTSYSILARRPDFIMINKKKITCQVVKLAAPAGNKRKRKAVKYLDLANAKTMELIDYYENNHNRIP